MRKRIYFPACDAAPTAAVVTLDQEEVARIVLANDYNGAIVIVILMLVMQCQSFKFYAFPIATISNVFLSGPYRHALMFRL